MPADVVDLTPDFLIFWEEARGCSPDDQHRLWVERYEIAHQALFAVCGDRHGKADALPAAMVRYPALVPQLAATVAQVHAAITRTTPTVAKLFGLDGLDLRIVLLVGMYWADGWVAEVEGVPTCFLAMEYLTPATEPRVSLLLAHETAHIAHAACLGHAWQELETVGQHLFLEGLAIVASAHLVPDEHPATYAWLGLPRTPRGLDPVDWLADCEQSWPLVRAQLQRDLGSTDPAVFGRYFLQAPSSMPERVGYYAGYRLVSAFAQQHTVAELARWSPASIYERVVHVLNAPGAWVA